MERKDFLKKTTKTCALCCGAMIGLGLNIPGNFRGDDGLSKDLRKRMVDGSKSPDWRKAEKAISWIKNMLDNIDDQLDEETKIKLLNACGRSCYIFATGVADDKKISKEDADGFILVLENSGHKIERKPDSTIIYYGWQGEQSPQGLSVKEGYCLCPIVESDIPGLSNSYCNCSAGYVKEIIERNTGRKVRKVEVLESRKRGGKDCRFRVELSNALS
jgi:hypothetical protein